MSYSQANTLKYREKLYTITILYSYFGNAARLRKLRHNTDERETEAVKTNFLLRITGYSKLQKILKRGQNKCSVYTREHTNPDRNRSSTQRIRIRILTFVKIGQKTSHCT